MTLNEFILHLETIRSDHGGEIKVEAKNECGELTVFEKNEVYTYCPGMTKIRLIIDA